MTRLRDAVGRRIGQLRMGWRHVLFANWPVDPGLVRAHLPDAMAVDTYEGDAWLSVVPFTNVDVRPPWAPAGWGVRLPELNLRTYVTVDGEPGVYFFSLDADGVLAVLGARLFHRLPYYYARMSLDAADGRISYASDRLHPGARPVRFRATYEPTGEAVAADPGSLARFLVRRDRYYVQDEAGAIRYATVSHEPWPLQTVTATITANTLFAANGFDRPDGDPHYLYSPGVDTLASANRRR